METIKRSGGSDLPRRAGVSSFGFGGVNAHVVIEEYIPQDLAEPQIAITPQNPAGSSPVIIVLSAKNEERLKEQAQRILIAIKEQGFSDANLTDLAYTLQVGREAMEERIAINCRFHEGTGGEVGGICGRPGWNREIYTGAQVKRNQATLAAFEADEDMAKTVDAWITKGNTGNY